MRRLRAVLIDDEKWTIQALRSLGNFAGNDIDIVGEASDGAFGLELIHQNQPDIILTDVRMPKMNGLDLAEELQKEGSHAQLIFVSGYDDYEYVHRALQAGAADYLLKPVKQEELNRALSQAAKNLRETQNVIPKERFDFVFPDHEWAKDVSDVLLLLENDIRTGSQEKGKQDFATLRSIALKREGISAQIYIYSLWMDRLLLLRSTLSDQNEIPCYPFGEGSSMGALLDFAKVWFDETMDAYRESMQGQRKFPLESIKKYLEENYRDHNLSLESVADQFGLSKEYLSRAYKKEYKTNFGETVISLRLEKAKELIEAGNMPLKEVALYVGYDDLPNFYRAFKKRYGVPPGSLTEVKK